MNNVCVIGAGRMGHGLAQLFATKGLRVELVSTKTSTFESARNQIISNLQLMKSEGILQADPEEVAESIDYTTDCATAVSEADFVLETVNEDMNIKKQVFALIDEFAPHRAILASNTSGLSISKIGASTSRPNMVIGCHWWNPPYLMPLVEVVPGKQTSNDTTDGTIRFIKSIGRETTLVRKEIPGFIWNRLQAAVIREAMRLMEEGVADAKNIDKVVKDGYALRSSVLGPIETIDLSGLRLWRTVCTNLFPSLSDAKTPSKLFDEKIQEGRLGAEWGKGFYDYHDKQFREVVALRDRALIRILNALGKKP